jgi:hypothetical protein
VMLSYEEYRRIYGEKPGEKPGAKPRGGSES